MEACATALMEPSHTPPRDFLLTAGTDRTGVGQAGFALDAGDRAEVLVDGTEVTIVHALIDRPRHDLKEGTKLGVRLIRVNASADD